MQSISHSGYGKRSASVLALVTSLISLPAQAQYSESNRVSDLPGVAAHTDPHLRNPWGIASSGTGPFWIADNGTGVSTLYDATGTPLTLVVTIPPPAGGMPPSAPTGLIFNGSKNFGLSNGSPARFLFATEDGTIAGWNRRSGSTAQRVVDHSGAAAVYKGLAMGKTAAGNFLYATNFHAATIDVFNSRFIPVTMPGGFTDPRIPAGYAPFGIRNIGGELYVTYAVQDKAKHDDVAGAGHGFVDVFDLKGHLLRRVASGGALNSPWGVALAPGNFGKFSHDLLIGNFGDGRINAFDPATHSFLGQIAGTNGKPISIDGLWSLTFREGSGKHLPRELFFTAGIAGPGEVEDHGLFGAIDPVPESSNLILLLCGGGMLYLWTGISRRRFAQPAA